MQVTRGLIAVIALILLSACAAKPEHILIEPSLTPPAAAQGREAPVKVEVIDQRTQNTIIGYRAEGESDLGRAVLASNDVATAVRDSLVDALGRLGFAPQPADGMGMGPAATLTVWINTLQYHQRGGGVNRVGMADVVVTGEARDGGTAFKAQYKVHKEDPLGILPTDTEKTRSLINRALGTALDNLLQDERVIAVLRG